MKYEIDLNPMTIHAAIEKADGAEYREIRDAIEDITRAARVNDEGAMVIHARILANVIDEILNDPAFIESWTDSAVDLIAAA